MASSSRRVAVLLNASTRRSLRCLQQQQQRAKTTVTTTTSADGRATLSTAPATKTDDSRPPPSAYSGRTGPSLRESLPDLPAAVWAATEQHSFEHTQITRLDSGLRVVTEPKYGSTSTLGVIVDAGARYQVAYPAGIIHLLEKLSFTSSAKYASSEAMHSAFEQYGAVWDAQATKDLFIFAANTHVEGIEATTELIADNVCRPAWTDKQINQAKLIVKYDVEAMNSSPDCEQILQDWIHQAAFRGNTIGLPKICPEENVSKFTPEMLYGFLASHFTPERMVVVGINADHASMCAHADKYFVQTPAVWQANKDLLPNTIPDVDTSVAQYTGGVVKVERDLSRIAAGTPYPNLAHIVLGLESSSFRDPDYVPFAVLNAMMGGGCHFSSGGPGKGMYTRLYTNVLNHYHWIYNATAYNHAYADSGLFCIHASADPSRLTDLTTIVTDVMIQLQGEYSKIELSRSKEQLKSLLLMNLEMRPVQFEDTGRMVMGLGHRKTPQEFIDEIDAVQMSDIQRCGQRLLASKPSLVGYGQLSGLPDYDTIDRCFADRSVKPLLDWRKKANKKFSFWSS